MTWDVDGNGQFDALTDGKLILGYLFGFTGEALIGNAIAPDATRREAGEIIAYIESIRDQLDVDGNGIIDALTDAILYLRYLFGFTGEALTGGAVGADATRDGAEQIVAYLESIGNQTTDPNPENDNFANAQEISGVPITSTGQNVSGTKEVDEPNHAGNTGGSSVWWSWTAQSNGSFRITTAGSDFDTVLGVYTGNSLSSLTEIASNDDSDDRSSRVTFSAVAGTNYLIAVDGFNGDAGNIILNIEDVVNAPNNDNFANAQEISGVPITSTGQNVSGTKEVDEPNHAGNTGGSSVWWSWTAQSNGSFRITTAGSDFDTVLGVYTGNSLSSLTEIASNDDREGTSSSVTFNAVAGTNYLIAVDGFNGASGNIILNIEDEVNAPNNDNFANAQEISGVPITSTGQNVSGTKEVDEPNHAGNTGGSSVWWSWTAQSNGSFTITTAGSDFDTVLGVYTGNSLSSLTEIASNDDSDDSDDSDALTSSVTFSAVAGTNYLIAVDGFDGDAGNIILSIDSASTVPLSSSKLSFSKTIDLPDLLIGTSASDMLVGRSKENIPMDASDGFMGISNSLTTGSLEISDPSNSYTVPIAAGNAVNANLPDLTTNSDDGFATVMSMIVDDNVNQNFPIA